MSDIDHVVSDIFSESHVQVRCKLEFVVIQACESLCSYKNTCFKQTGRFNVQVLSDK